MRHAQSFKPASYTCPLCSKQLHAMSDHILVKPEGDPERRRHAHPACVHAARTQGLLPSREEFERSESQSQPRQPGRLARLFRRL